MRKFLAILLTALLIPVNLFAFACTDITGCKLWLKADALGLSDGAAVSSWTDSSGNSNPATQSTGGLQPIYKTNIINGLAVVRFNGTDPGGTYLRTASVATTSTSYTWCMVSKKTGTISVDSAPFLNGNGNGFGYRISISGDSVRWAAHRGVANMNDGTMLVAAFELVCVTRTSTGPAIAFYLNGASQTILADGGMNAGSGYTTVGALDDTTNEFAGDIAELIIYDSQLGTTDLNTVTSYLCGKYNITGTSPCSGTPAGTSIRHRVIQ